MRSIQLTASETWFRSMLDMFGVSIGTSRKGLFWQAQWYAREQNASAGLFGRRSLYTPALSFASRDRPTSVQRHQRASLVGLRRSCASGLGHIRQRDGQRMAAGG